MDMHSVQSQKGRFTEEEYFEQLKNAEHKLEYLDGVIRSMAGGTLAHSTITENTFFHLRANKGNCTVKSSEMAVSIQSRNRYFFPDVSAVCNKEIKLDESKGIARMTNPCLIIEVLSETTADYDRGEKFRTYRQLESFKEYLLIDSRKLSIDYFYREINELWHIRSFYKIGQEVEIKTLGITLPVSAFYEGVELPPEADDLP
jgi:Uma2 family endonuclease